MECHGRDTLVVLEYTYKGVVVEDGGGYESLVCGIGN